LKAGVGSYVIVMTGSGIITELFQELNAVNGYALEGGYIPGVRTLARISPFDRTDLDPFRREGGAGGIG
jgi:hypothetical protein